MNKDDMTMIPKIDLCTVDAGNLRMAYKKLMNEHQQLLASIDRAAPAVQGEPVAITDADILAIAGRVESCPVSPWWLKDDVEIGDVRAAVLRFARALLVAAPQPAEQKPTIPYGISARTTFGGPQRFTTAEQQAAPDVAGLVDALEKGFPLLSDEGLDEVEHHCEWVIQRERKRVHSILADYHKGGDQA